MDRLTNSIDYCKMHCDFGSDGRCFFEDKSKCYEKSMYEKLREYEDAEEQGLLLRLPIRVGDKFWELNDRVPEPYVYSRIAHSISHVLYCKTNLGKTTFLTREEAEAELRIMKEEKNE